MCVFVLIKSCSSWLIGTEFLVLSEEIQCEWSLYISSELSIDLNREDRYGLPTLLLDRRGVESEEMY